MTDFDTIWTLETSNDEPPSTAGSETIERGAVDYRDAVPGSQTEMPVDGTESGVGPVAASLDGSMRRQLITQVADGIVTALSSVVAECQQHATERSQKLEGWFRDELARSNSAISDLLTKKGEFDRLLNRVGKQDEVCNELKASIHNLTASIIAFEERLTHFEGKLQTSRADRERLFVELDTKIDELFDRMRSQQNEHAELSAKVAVAISHLERHDEMLQAQREAIQALNGSHRTKLEALDQVAAIVNRINSAVSEPGDASGL